MINLSIKKNKIISEKIKSEKSEELYYQYFLDSKSQSVTKLEYIKQGGADMNIFKLNSKRITRCLDIKANWDKQKIDKAKIKINDLMTDCFKLSVPLIVDICAGDNWDKAHK